MEMRAATRDKLGAIIVGDGFEITEEGVLTVDEDALDEYVNTLNLHATNYKNYLKEVKRGGSKDGEE